MKLELTDKEAELVKTVLECLYHEHKSNDFRNEILDKAVKNRVHVVGRILTKLAAHDWKTHPCRGQDCEVCKACGQFKGGNAAPSCPGKAA